MATTTRTATTCLDGLTSWVVQTNLRYGGATSNVSYGVRNQIDVGGISALGRITGMSVYIDPESTAAMAGDLYVTTNASYVRSNIATYGTYIGTTSIAAGGVAQNVTIGSFNGEAFKNAIGAATTWYFIWITSNTTLRYLHVQSVKPVYTITYQPNSMWINAGGTWKLGVPYVNVSAVWRVGDGWVNAGGTWKQGI